MWRSCRRWLALACPVLLTGAAAWAADDPPKAITSKPGEAARLPSVAQETKADGARPLDTFKLPAGAIFVIGKELSDAIGFSPEMFVLKKKDYDALMERIEQLERLLKLGKPQAPSACKISGQVEGDRGEHDR